MWPEALSRRSSGARYLLAGENRTYAEFFRLLAARTGCRPLLIPIPDWLLLAVGAVGDLLAWAGVKSEISRANMRILCIGNYYSNTKSRRGLHLRYRPLSEAVDEAVGWFRLRGMLQTERR